MPSAQFATGSSKIGKRAAGRSALGRTPVVIRSPDPLGAGFEQRIRTQLARRIGHAAGRIERITVRFDDVNGPRGGVDTVCRIKVVVTGRPSILVEKQASVHGSAFARAAASLGTAIRQAQGKHGLSTGRRPGPGAPRGLRALQTDEGELIGRRVGRGPTALARALHRPEKADRAHYVDTSARGASASDRRAGGPFTARRNTRAHAPRATAMLEDSRTRPSRKTTRRSANRGKPGQTKERAAAASMWTPGSRSTRRG